MIERRVSWSELVWLASLCTIACGAPPETAEGGSVLEPAPRTVSEAPPPPADPLPAELNLPGDDPAGPPAPSGHGLTFWSVSDDGRLVSFDERSPETVNAQPITGLLSGERIVGLDFRPKDDRLYALGSSSRLYTIDGATGAATAVGPKLVVALKGTAFGFDFDPGTDLARVYSDLDQNITVDPVTGWVANNDLGLTYAEGDPNAQTSPTIVASAFAAPPPGALVSPPLFAIDAALGVLTTTADPWTGRVSTVGSLGVDTSKAVAFGLDVAPTGKAFAVVSGSDETALYTIDLETGRAARAAKVGVTVALHGLAIQP